MLCAVYVIVIWLLCNCLQWDSILFCPTVDCDGAIVVVVVAAFPFISFKPKTRQFHWMSAWKSYLSVFRSSLWCLAGAIKIQQLWVDCSVAWLQIWPQLHFKRDISLTHTLVGSRFSSLLNRVFAFNSARKPQSNQNAKIKVFLVSCRFSSSKNRVVSTNFVTKTEAFEFY